MATRNTKERFAQAWIELHADDPAARSAWMVARRQLPAGRKLDGLRRLRLIELTGALPPRRTLASRLHASSWFYNPHKESCRLRTAVRGELPLKSGEHAVLVVDRGATRRVAAERWWLHETGRGVSVREGIVWITRFEAGAPAAELTEDLAAVRHRRHGLFCNPHAQSFAVSGARVPFPWIQTLPDAGEPST